MCCRPDNNAGQRTPKRKDDKPASITVKELLTRDVKTKQFKEFDDHTFVRGMSSAKTARGKKVIFLDVDPGHAEVIRAAGEHQRGTSSYRLKNTAWRDLT